LATKNAENTKGEMPDLMVAACQSLHPKGFVPNDHQNQDLIPLIFASFAFFRGQSSSPAVERPGRVLATKNAKNTKGEDARTDDCCLPVTSSEGIRSEPRAGVRSGFDPLFFVFFAFFRGQSSSSAVQ
jgi:hypothetical protein